MEKINELERRWKSDPRHLKKFQERPKPPLGPPTRIRRVPGEARQNWGLTRTMRGYQCVEAATRSIQGRAPKWIIERVNDGKDFYIAKLGSKNGRVEVLTELFNNELGAALGLPMAHHGIARMDDHLYFVTKNFTHEGVGLVHGSLLIADALHATLKEVEAVAQDSEQQFYEVSMIEEAIKAICGKQSTGIFQALIDMLVFDALIGCSDRHTMNWGILRPEKETDGENRHSFAPIFDSARALGWDLTESKLLQYDLDDGRLEAFLERSHPCIGPRRTQSKTGKHSHFDLVKSLRAEYPHQTLRAFASFKTVDITAVAKSILCRCPYKVGFTGLRKRMILKILSKRIQRLRDCVERMDGGIANEMDRQT